MTIERIVTAEGYAEYMEQRAEFQFDEDWSEMWAGVVDEPAPSILEPVLPSWTPITSVVSVLSTQYLVRLVPFGGFTGAWEPSKHRNQDPEYELALLARAGDRQLWIPRCWKTSDIGVIRFAWGTGIVRFKGDQ